MFCFVVNPLPGFRGVFFFFVLKNYFGVILYYLAGRTNIKPTIDLLQENLSVRPGKTIAVDDLVHLGTDEKEAIRSLIDIFKKTKSK